MRGAHDPIVDLDMPHLPKALWLRAAFIESEIEYKTALAATTAYAAVRSHSKSDPTTAMDDLKLQLERARKALPYNVGRSPGVSSREALVAAYREYQQRLGDKESA